VKVSPGPPAPVGGTGGSGRPTLVVANNGNGPHGHKVGF
jgi:hypothetical protein